MGEVLSPVVGLHKHLNIIFGNLNVYDGNVVIILTFCRSMFGKSTNSPSGMHVLIK